MRVLPDETAIDKVFDYRVPTSWDRPVEIGTRVRVALGPRRVGGWVVATDVVPTPGVEVRPLAHHSGVGPDAELIELARWARWRWAARSPVPFLRTASPDRTVARLPPAVARTAPVPPPVDDVVAGAFAAGPDTVRVLRLAPGEDVLPVCQAAASLGDALVLCTSRAGARRLGARLGRAGVHVAVHPEDWARAAAGGAVVVGTRAAAWARVPDLAAVVVLDEHDEAHQEEGSPTWHARDVAIERARRRGIPCVLVSPTPTLEALRAGPLRRADRGRERAGWPAAVVVDRREDDVARNALFSPALVDVVRSSARLVCVLNQKGRAALLACGTCSSIAACERCGSAMAKPGDALVCRRCAHERPVVCADCGGVRLKTIRLGVTRVVEDLAALAGEPVAEVTAQSRLAASDRARLVAGTEAALHQVTDADVVAFLDFDQELLAPRYRAAEQALALVARAGRIVRGRRDGGRVLLQTRLPDHVVCRAAVTGDPSLVSDLAARDREAFGLPPFRAVAEVAGAAAPAFVSRLVDVDVDVRGPLDGRWRVEAADHETLCDALASVDRPPGRLRLAVDPPRD